MERVLGWKDSTALRFTRVAYSVSKSAKLEDLNVRSRDFCLLAAPSTPAEVIEPSRSADGERVSLEEAKRMIA